MQAVISVSGGMDSTSLLLNVLRNKEIKRVTLLNFNYGQKQSIEMVKLQHNVKYLQQRGFELDFKAIDLSPVMKLFYSSLLVEDIKVPKDEHYSEKNQRSTVVPNRNAIFSSLIYGLALSNALKYKDKVIIGLGVHSGDYSVYPDCRPEFYKQLEKAFQMGNWESDKVSFYNPFINGKKIDILKDAVQSCKELDVNFNIIFRNTNTCYDPDLLGYACGHCASCIERLEAFDSLGIKDPCLYTEDYNALLENMRKVINNKK